MTHSLSQRINPIERWNIHSSNYALKKRVRVWLFNHCYRWVKSGMYNQPKEVGYLGWLELPLFGVIAFIRVDTHDLQFDW